MQLKIIKQTNEKAMEEIELMRQEQIERIDKLKKDKVIQDTKHAKLMKQSTDEYMKKKADLQEEMDCL
jgi:ribosome recycling factor